MPMTPSRIYASSARRRAFDGSMTRISLDSWIALDHDWLLEMLRERIDDGPFLGLIATRLKAGILERDGTPAYPEAGTPQGGTMSPVLTPRLCVVIPLSPGVPTSVSVPSSPRPGGATSHIPIARREDTESLNP
jgi:hypothetical protein